MSSQDVVHYYPSSNRFTQPCFFTPSFPSFFLFFLPSTCPPSFPFSHSFLPYFLHPSYLPTPFSSSFFHFILFFLPSFLHLLIPSCFSSFFLSFDGLQFSLSLVLPLICSFNHFLLTSFLLSSLLRLTSLPFLSPFLPSFPIFPCFHLFLSFFLLTSFPFYYPFSSLPSPPSLLPAASIDILSSFTSIFHFY